jgi:hypothetical protein
MRGSVRSLCEHVFVQGTRESIERLLRAGVHPNEIARRLRLAGTGPPPCRSTNCSYHVNGDRDDNRLENLSLLCPNCHSQTGNFSDRKAS